MQLEEKYLDSHILKKEYFDLVIFSSIHRQIGYFLQYYPYLKPEFTVILDGEDHGALFSYSGFYWRKYYYWLLPKIHKKFFYFKREINEETNYFRFYKILPKKLANELPLPKNLKQISFSIPQNKIVKTIPAKEKLFPTHIVDEEVSAQVEGSQNKYAFKNEAEYYLDIQKSKFGITTKRAGWDCLRHYEIAANGTVICFRDLNKKPPLCAPHGLIDGVNCINYSNYEDLISRINSINNKEYEKLANASIEWANQNSCENAALRLLNNFNF